MMRMRSMTGLRGCDALGRGRDRRQPEEREPSRPGPALPPAAGARCARERDPRVIKSGVARGHLQVHVALPQRGDGRDGVAEPELLEVTWRRFARRRSEYQLAGRAGSECGAADPRHVRRRADESEFRART